MSSKTGKGGHLKSKKEKSRRKSVHDSSSEEEDKGGKGGVDGAIESAIDEVNEDNEWMYERECQAKRA